MMKLGAAMALPTLLFWASWTYKGQNYNLPAMPALLLFGWACFNGSPPRLAWRLSGALGAAAIALVVAVVAHFWPLPAWWGGGWIALTFVAMAAYAALFLLSDDVRVLVAGAAAFCLAFGAAITPLGQREMIDARQFLREHPDATYHYYNLDPSIWSEWALLQLTLHHKIHGLHRPEQLSEAVRPNHAVLVQNHENLEVVLGYWRQHARGVPKPIVTPWTRWLTKGHTPDGKSRWRTAWEARDLAQLEREFFIVYFPEPR
jgi:hypothetical protein